MAPSDSEQAYDVFLCHNSLDKAAVRTINERLRQEYGLRTYLDEATIVGGEAWERSIERALAAASACAVIVGPNGWGPYQLTHEARPAVRRREADPTFRVIPVLLPGVNVGALADFAALFRQTHWVTFGGTADDPLGLRTLAFAIRGQNAFPEGPPRLTASRVRFDAIRWDTGGRRDDSVLYGGQVLREAVLLFAEGDDRDPLVQDFLAASRRHHDQRLAQLLAGHANVIWSNPRQRDLAARLAIESVRRAATAEALSVLRQSYGQLHTVRRRLGHPSAVMAGASDAAGDRLATGCQDGSVCLWDGEAFRVLGTHAAPVRAVVDLGACFATGSSDGTVLLWKWPSGAAAGRLEVGATIEKLEAGRLGDTTVLLTSGGDPGQPGVVSLWDADSGTERWRTGMVTDAVLDGDRPHVVLAWGDHVAVRHCEDGRLIEALQMDDTVISVAAHPAVRWVAATTLGRSAYLVSFESDPPGHSVLGNHISRIGLVRISPDGRWIAAVRDDFHIALWNIADQTPKLLKSEGLFGVAPHFSDQSRYIAIVSPEASAITVWRTETGEHVCTVEQENPNFALFDDESRSVWMADDGARAKLVVLPTQNEALLAAAPGITLELSFAPDGRTLAWVGTSVADDLSINLGRFNLVVVDVISATTRIETQLTELSTVAFDDTSTKIAAVGPKVVRVWELLTGVEEPVPGKPFWADEPDRNVVVSALRDQPSVAAAIAQRGFVRGVASRDGRFVAIDHGQQLVSVWSARATTEIATFSMSADVTELTFSVNGERFASGDARGDVMVWQTDGTYLGPLKHDEPISHLAFNHDGSLLAVASRDAVVRVWIVAPDVLAAQVAGIVSGPLTAAEWTRYLGDEPMRDTEEGPAASVVRSDAEA